MSPSNNMNSYQSITVHHGEDDKDTGVDLDISTTGSNGGSSYNKKTLVTAAVTAALLVLCLLSVRTTSSSSLPAKQMTLDDVPMEGAAKTRVCTFDECLKSQCNPTAAPYFCLFHNGGPHGGCSAVPWSGDSCDVSCDTSPCDDMPVPDDIPSCDGKPCTKAWCSLAAGQLCGPAAPYQCTEGGARFGCSDDADHWLLNGCNCCDATTC